MSSKKTNKQLFFLFSQNILDIIKEKCGDDKYEFAKKIEVHYDTVRRWSNGANLPDGGDLLKIKEKFGVSIDWLLTGAAKANVAEKTVEESSVPYRADSPRAQELKRACQQVKNIILSNHPVIKPALLSNLAAFEYSIEKEMKQDEKIKKINKRVKELENALSKGQLTGIGEAASSNTGKQGM